MIDAPEKIWIEHDDCQYFYEESELTEAGSPVTEYVRADLAILSALEPSAARELALEEAAHNLINELSGNPGELIDKMAEAIRDWGSHYDDGPWETLPEDRKAGWRGDAERALAAVKEYLTTRALSSPDHADAGKVEGDGWLPIESAPKDRTSVIIAVPAEEKKDGFIVGEAYFDPENYEGGDWWWAGSSHTDHFDSPISDLNYNAPTHWRPLPSAPSEGAE